MKKYHFLILIGLLFTSCIPVKSVKDVSGYHIVKGQRKAGKDFRELSTFTFQIYRHQSVFSDFLRARFYDGPNFNSSNFNVEIEDVPFTIRVLSKEDADRYLDFTDYIFEKEDPELVKNGKKKRFVYIVATDENGKDCLSTNSFYRYIVAKYLDDLRMRFKAY